MLFAALDAPNNALARTWKMIRKLQETAAHARPNEGAGEALKPVSQGRSWIRAPRAPRLLAPDESAAGSRIW
jgi:hypothetical protein